VKRDDNRVRTVAVAGIVTALVAVAMTACAQPPNQQAASTPTTERIPTSALPTNATAAPVASATQTPPTTTAPVATQPIPTDSSGWPTKAAYGPSGCPVTVATLKAALIASGKYYFAYYATLPTLVLGTCYLGYVKASPPPGNYVGDPGQVLFGYLSGTGWIPLNNGSAIECNMYMTSEIADKVCYTS
jgi:hypothetical protein